MALKVQMYMQATEPYSMRLVARSQCNDFNTGEMCSDFLVLVRRHAGEFWTLCIGPIAAEGRLTRRISYR
jgi:hypothetical protein